MHRFLLVLPGLFLYSTAVLAEGSAEQNISHALQGVFPDMEITRIRESQIPGLYEVMMGAEVVYATADGRYLMKGDLYDLGRRKNLSENERQSARVDILSQLPASEYIEFAPGKTKHSIYVFTDITCPYCRRFHQDVPELNREGIAVRYLAFPRAGVDSPAFRVMESIWCAKDRRKALTSAKHGEFVKPAECKNPVAKQYALGQAMGVRGTPAIYLENGKELPGYMPPDELLDVIRKN